MKNYTIYADILFDNYNINYYILDLIILGNDIQENIVCVAGPPRVRGYANIWKWQEFPFNENVLKTMKDVRPALIEIEKSQSKESKKFNFKTFKNSIV